MRRQSLLVGAVFLVGCGAAAPPGRSTAAAGGNTLACNAEPPEGAPLPAPLPIYGGVCPELAPAPAENLIVSSGSSRRFLLAVPANRIEGEKLPVIFLWHWLGGSPLSFYTLGDIQNAVDTQRFLAVIPFKKGDLSFTWPFHVLDSQARLDEEYRFFDDMLACVAAAFPGANRNCVASAGVSAGALFTDQLGAARAQLIASLVSLSGGVGTGIIRNWGNPEHRLPALVLWGGPSDTCFGLINFQNASRALEDALESRSHFFVECVHNCGHAQPPLQAPPGLSIYAALWQFVFDHPYWLGPGDSPYIESLPEAMPSWCGIGKDSATPRTGECPNPPGC